jgi:hypothetical protein
LTSNRTANLVLNDIRQQSIQSKMLMERGIVRSSGKTGEHATASSAPAEFASTIRPRSWIEV